MKKTLLVIIAVVVTVSTLATGSKVWVYCHSGAHQSIDITEFDSISFVEPGYLEVSPVDKLIGKEGGRFSIDIVANKPWTATVNDPAIILGSTHGVGTAVIVATALPNADDDPYTAVITVTLDDGTFRQAFVTVGYDKGKLTALKFKDENYVIAENNYDLNLRRKLECTPAGVLDTCRVSWRVSDTSVAYMYGNYLVPVKPGTVNVTATIQGESAVCSVTVTEPEIYGLYIDDINVNVNQTAQLVYRTDPQGIPIQRFSLTCTDPSIATVSPDGVVTGLKVGSTTLIGKYGEDIFSSCRVTVIDDTPTPPQSEYPTVPGTAGKYTIVFHAPEIDCSYPTIYFFGDFQYNDPSDIYAPRAERIVQTGFTNWYKIVFESDSQSAASGKICPNSIDGTMGWNNQGTLSLISGNASIINDFGTSNKIICKEEGGVVYVEVTKWAGDVCDYPNPKGTATFNVIVKGDFPVGFDLDDLEVSAAFWTPGTVSMTLDRSYTGDGYRFVGVHENYPANQQYKYTVKYKDSSWVWEEHENRQMPYSLITDDVVSEWESVPWNQVEGGEGTFTFVFDKSCNADAQDRIIFTGNFDVFDWHFSDREMVRNNDGSYSWTGEYPDNFRYKVIFRNNGADDVFVGPEDYFLFDGRTFVQTWSCE